MTRKDSLLKDTMLTHCKRIPETLHHPQVA
jgi:hypothetical protein